ncbi:hypothetical protein AB4P95_30155 (plasmid) [Pseudomonas sp. A1437]|uniref:hypothetical protein n=1 Tax=Pseudomonas sp. A1437 TaxID=3235107 RepID=UPI0037831310
MSEQKEAAALAQCYLVTLEVEYEEPTIIKGFGCHADAEAFQAELEAYQQAKPEWPADDAPKEEWSSFPESREAWLNAHPGGSRATGADKFCIVAVPFVPPVSEPVGIQSMETAPRDGTHILVKYIVTHYVREPRPSPFGGFGHGEYRPVGHKWEEFRFVDGKFQTWSGTDKSRSINGGGEPIGWAPIPGDKAPEPRAVDLPAFDGYQAHIVRELQAAFVQACEKAGIKVRTL